MKEHRFFSRKKYTKWVEFFIGFLCTVFIFLTLFFNIPLLTSIIQYLDGQIYDQIIRLNWHKYPQIPQVIIVDIDEKSVQKEGRWPWPRDKMANLVNKLKGSGVVTIGLDIVMSEPETNYAIG
ncbi:CHASE2 domain-containing protein [Legionella norrlandica]|uniref:CHASE2 domain-containing protein n=1 Tax=Legionella norrlandica TaxID=1498499 RepID=UPI000A54219C|nr:CHASE2 domain-containing protein [Legionella norrlandica]